MRITPLCNQRHNSIHAQLSCLFDYPLHAIKFEHCQPECNTALRFRLDTLQFLRQLEYNFLLGYLLNPAQKDGAFCNDFKLLPDACAKHLCQVFGVLPVQKSLIALNSVRDPAASCHLRKSTRYVATAVAA